MSGGTVNHFRIITKLINLLSILLGDSDCKVFGTGMRARRW